MKIQHLCSKLNIFDKMLVSYRKEGAILMHKYFVLPHVCEIDVQLGKTHSPLPTQRQYI